MQGGMMGPGMMGAGGAPAAPQTDVSGVALEGPKGPGWVIEIKGHHFFNADRQRSGGEHLRETLLKNLEHGFVDLPVGPGGALQRFTMKELGIGYAILALNTPIRNVTIPNPNYEQVVDLNQNGGFGSPMGPMGPMGPGGRGGNAREAAKDDPNNPQFFTVPRHDFIVQFCWQEKPLNVRLEERRLRLEAEAKLAAEAAAAAAAAGNGTAPAGGAPASVPAAPGAPAPGVPQAPAAPVVPLPVDSIPLPVDAVPAPSPAPAAPQAPGAPAAPAPILPEAPEAPPAGAAPVPAAPGPAGPAGAAPAPAGQAAPPASEIPPG
jgi:hypothetical protein